MAISSTRLALLKAEYETTPISIEELCIYHQVQPSDLKGYTKWQKSTSTIVETLDTFDSFLEPEPLQPAIEILPPLQNQLKQMEATPPTTSAIDIEDVDTLKEDIKTCKTLAIARCKDFLANEAKFAEVKEIKDVVAIVTDIDKSLSITKGPTGNSYTVLINNLIANFRDDC